jgi:hypothetical protein
MKQSRAVAGFVSLAVIAMMAGCGGSNSTPNSATVSGTVSGLPSQGVFLVNNGSDTILANNDSFTFDTKMLVGSSYNVTVLQPSGTACIVANGTGKIDQNADSVTNIAVTCQSVAVALPYSYVSVSVKGVASGGSATFLLNGGTPLVANANGLFVFSGVISPDGPVGQGGPGAYNVTVLANPTGQTCSLTNPSGTVFGEYVNVSATCQ